jgi:hypothetical protein
MCVLLCLYVAEDTAKTIAGGDVVDLVEMKFLLGKELLDLLKNSLGVFLLFLKKKTEKI